MTETQPGKRRPDSNDRPAPAGDHPDQGISQHEEEEIEERRPLRAAVVYEIIRTEGEGELARSVNALWWSGLAAGLSIGLSVVAEALIATYVPDNPWKPILQPLGYASGFIVVIMARQQLFTENTLTAVLPVMARRKLRWLIVMLRFWAIVFAANVTGCIVFATVLAYSSMLEPAVLANVGEIAGHMMANSPSQMLIKGIAAGWLIAALVWMLPAAENAAFFLVGMVTYVISLGGFTHVIAGSTEAFYLLFTGGAGLAEVLFGFLAPTFVGNIVGGTVLFAVLSYAQVREEIAKSG